MEENKLKEFWDEGHTQKTLQGDFPNVAPSKDINCFICYFLDCLDSCQRLGYDHHGTALALFMDRKCLFIIFTSFFYRTLSTTYTVGRPMFNKGIRRSAQEKTGTKNQY